MPNEGACFEKRSEFFAAVTVRSSKTARDGLWCSVDEAMRALRPESHRWALQQLTSFQPIR